MSFPQASDYRPPIIPDGEIYDNPENGKSYYWTQILLPEGSTPDTATSIGGYWTVVCEAEDPRFVLKAGDTMTGALELAKPLEDTEDGDGFIIRGTTALNYEDNTGDDEDGKLFSAYHNAGAADAINYLGKINATNNIVNKGYVDEKDDLLRQDIIELEEEINAIAPSLEYGSWKFEVPASPNRPPTTGTFYLLDGTSYTTEYKDTTAIAIHNDEYVHPGDLDPVDNHTWADADPGESIQLFDAADPDFFLGKITNKTIDSIGNYVLIQVERVQSSGVPNDNADPVTGEFLTRVNIFKEPSGGNASDFVMKIGDEMSGNLTMGENFAAGTDANSPEIRFVNQDNYDTEYTCKLSTTAGSTRLNLEGGGGFAVHGSVYSSQHYQYWDRSNNQGNVRLGMDGTGGFLANHGGGSNVNDSNKQLTWTTGGKLMYNGDARVLWKSAGGELKKGTSIVLEWDNSTVAIRKNLSFNTSDSRIYARTSSSTTSISVGTAGQVLASNGTSNPPYWTNQTGVPSGGSKGQVLKKSHNNNTVGWEGAIGINSDGTNRAKGEMWYNPNDGTLYLKVS